METVNFTNVIKSFFLGIVIGVMVQLQAPPGLLPSYKVMSVLASGSIGFIIGLITEWITSMLPLRLARMRTYFLINGLIALSVTFILLIGMNQITVNEGHSQEGFLPVVAIVLGIVGAANLLDYMWYRRTQHKLDSFKASMKER
ncbi:hypothetical protein [Paenibacillus sp. SYP-B4298]|uniref:hypothetical protein n=1 Tax=Paenibacillus sp. SYP-B4298 TaxID=2996034 RepID=UPI0022DDA077|nr:hypothetical protein [Paenibacillus sp. SYP-B4298]